MATRAPERIELLRAGKTNCAREDLQSSEWGNAGGVRELEPRATPGDKGQISKRINAESVRE
jgi:hypothetical protein